MKITIGTAQFGLDYGIANRNGRVLPAEAEKIIKYGRANGIDALDTAIAYGESEQVLGHIGMANWNVTTKLPSLPTKCSDVEAWIRQQVNSSLAHLGIKTLHGLLLHNPADVLGVNGAAISRALHDLKQDGLVKKVGFSIYSPDSLAQLLQVCTPDLVQAPLNVIDRRLPESGWLQRLIDQGIEVHVRSVFMQGLLLLNDEGRPSYFARWQSLWTYWSEYLAANGGDAVAACLGFIKSYSDITSMVVGVDSEHHLHGLLEAFDKDPRVMPGMLSCSESDLIDPVNWKLA